MKALEKDRTRRYQTANALAADVRRHLQQRAGLGRAAEHGLPGRGSSCGGIGSAWRRPRRWCCCSLALRRDDGRAGAADRARARPGEPRGCARQPGSCGGDTGHGVHDRACSRYRTRARRVETRSRRAKFLTRGCSASTRKLTGEPPIQTRIMTTMGQVYSELGLDQRAEQLHRRALAMRRNSGEPAIHKRCSRYTA